MPNTFRCPACGQTVSDNVPAGMQINCPFCRSLITVPPDGSGVAVAGPMPSEPPPVAPLRVGLAVTSLVCGIVGFCIPLLDLLAIVLGIIAMRKARRQPAVFGGRGLAIGGVCTGAGGIVLRVMLIALLLPSLARAREQARRVVCANNLRQIALVIHTQGEDNRGRLPATLEEVMGQRGLSAEQFCCPSARVARGGVHVSYEYIPGQGMSDNPQNVLMYDKPANHRGEGMNILFLDGHVQFVKPLAKAEQLIAQTKERIAQRHKPWPTE